MPAVSAHTGCTAATNRTVASTYTHGFLTGVTGYASSISYHPNGQVNQIVRANNITDTYTADPQNQLRPNKIETKVTSTGAIVWSSGVYSYDGAGNVVKVDHAYDGFGNLQSMTSNGKAFGDESGGGARKIGRGRPIEESEPGHPVNAAGRQPFDF